MSTPSILDSEKRRHSSQKSSTIFKEDFDMQKIKAIKRQLNESTKELNSAGANLDYF